MRGTTNSDDSAGNGRNGREAVMAGATKRRTLSWAAAAWLLATACAPSMAAAWDDGENALVQPCPEALGETPPLPDDACLEAIRGMCCPDWRRYVIFDVLFLQRNNQSGDRTLVSDAATGLPAITTQDLQPAVATGFRAFYGSLLTDDLGWEIGYLGVYGMFGQATATGPDTLEMPPPLGLAVNNFNNAESARATFWSTLNMAEVNLFRYDCCQECGPTGCRLTNCRSNCHCIDWLAGFVWAGLDEQASLSMACCSPPEPAAYTVRSTTNYFGPQIGMRGRRQWERWAVEGWWKTAVCGTSGSQAGDPIVGTISGLERPAVAATAAGVGFIGNLNATLIYRLTETWGLRAGYNLIWLTNATLAPTQWDFGTAAGAGTGINDNGGLFLHGANLGLEARW
jgi:hypothetical protein